MRALAGTWAGMSRDRVRSAATLALAQAVNLAAILLVTRIYPAAVFGTFATLFAVAAVVAGVSSLRLDVAATTASGPDAASLLRVACRLNLVAGAGVATVLAGWRVVGGGAQPARLVEALALGAVVAAVGLSTTLAYARLRDRRYGLVAASKLVIAMIQFIVQVGVGSAAPTAGTLLLACALGYGAGALLLARRGRALPAGQTGPTAGVAPVPDVLRRHRGFVLASAPASLIGALALQLPVIIAATAMGAAAAGQLALALRIGLLPLALVGQALMPLLFGEIAHQLRVAPDRALRSYDRALVGMTAAGIVSVTALALAVQAAAPLVFGAEWAGVGAILLLLAPFLISQFAVAPLSQTLNAVGRNGWQLTWDTGRLLLTVAAFVPVVAGWVGLPAGVALYSAVMVAAYLAHVLVTRAALRAVGPTATGPPARVPERPAVARV